jgi:hypothetical protein
MYVKLGETIRGVFGTAAFGTGAATDADSLPTCVVLDQGTPLGYAPLVVHKATGLYEVVVVASGGNGFIVGHEYSLYVTVIVGGVTARAPVSGIASFNVTARSVDDLAFPAVSGRSMAVDVSGNVNATVTNLTAIVNAVLDELLSGHAVIGSVGDGIAIAAGLLQGNFFMDQTNNTDPNGQTAARLRVFRTGIAAQAATDGGSGQGEFASFTVTTTYVGPNKIATHRVVRQ